VPPGRRKSRPQPGPQSGRHLRQLPRHRRRAVAGSGEALAGTDKAKLMQKLMDFRSGAKPATIMHQISKGYTEAQLELVAAYFAARK
jgi:cytochrome c553